MHGANRARSALTPRQRDILSHIERFTADAGHSPNDHQLSLMAGLSLSAVQGHLRQLKRLGSIESDPAGPRRGCVRIVQSPLLASLPVNIAEPESGHTYEEARKDIGLFLGLILLAALLALQGCRVTQEYSVSYEHREASGEVVKAAWKLCTEEPKR
jgi:SOS-response transcriptional repressor LexA